MNGKLASFWESAGGAVLIAAAFLLPVAFYLETFDPALVKSLTLGLAATLAAAAWLARQIESGRVEIPVSRAAYAGLTAIAILWALVSYFAGDPASASCLSALRGVSFLLLFGALLLGPVSTGFSDSLSTALLGAGALAVFSAPVVAPEHQAVWAVLSAAAVPLALARWADPEASTPARAVAVACALACLWSVAASGGHDALAALAVGGFSYWAVTASQLHDDRQKISGLAGLATVPLAAWIFASRPDAALLGALQSWNGARVAANAAWGTLPWTGTGLGTLKEAVAAEPFATAAETGAVGLALWGLLAAFALWLSWKEAHRRAEHGEYRVAGVLAGQRSAFAGLLAAGILGAATRTPAVGAAYWLLAASLVGLSTERGASRVYVFPIPAPLFLRRVLLVPVGAVLFLIGSWSAAQWNSDLNLNQGLFNYRNHQPEAALKFLAKVAPSHQQADRAVFLSGEIYRERGDLEMALAFYRQTGFPDAALQEGLVLAKLSRYEQAQRALSNAIAKNPDNADAYEALIDVQQSLGRTAQAREAALQLVRIDPDQARYWRLLAEQYHSLHRVRTARMLFNKATNVGRLVKGPSDPARG